MKYRVKSVQVALENVDDKEDLIYKNFLVESGCAVFWGGHGVRHYEKVLVNDDDISPLQAKVSLRGLADVGWMADKNGEEVVFGMSNQGDLVVEVRDGFWA